MIAWSLEIIKGAEGNGGTRLDFVIVNAGDKVNLSDSAFSGAQADYVYKVCRFVTNNSQVNWIEKLEQAREHLRDPPSCEYIIERFARALIVAVTRSTPERNDLPNLRFGLLILEGQNTNSVQALERVFREAVEIERIVDNSTPEFEEAVLQLVTTTGGLLRAQTSDRLAQMVREWAETRGAVDRLRAFFPQLPWLFRLDAIRLFLVVTGCCLWLFLSWTGNRPYERTVEGLAVTAGVCVALLFVFWTLLAPALVYRRYPALRPLFTKRAAPLVTMLPIVAFSDWLWKEGFFEIHTPALVVVLLLGISFSAWYWYSVCALPLTYHPGRPETKQLIWSRSFSLLCLTIEESLALALGFDLCLGSEKSAKLQMAVLDPVKDEFHRSWLREVTIRSSFGEWQLHPSFLIMLISITLAYSLVLELNRRRVLSPNE